MEIGDRIFELRDKKGWSTNKLADNCGVSQSFLRSVELNKKGISVEYLEYVCDSLDITLKQFFDIPQPDDSPQVILQRQIESLTPHQQKLLSAFLDSLTNPPTE